MELLELGNSGVMIPEVGLGTWKYTGGDAPLRRGIELGANLVDTAEIGFVLLDDAADRLQHGELRRQRGALSH